MGAESADGDDDGEDEVGGGEGVKEGGVVCGWVSGGQEDTCTAVGCCCIQRTPSHPLPLPLIWLPCRSTECGGGGMSGSSGQQPAAAHSRPCMPCLIAACEESEL